MYYFDRHTPKRLNRIKGYNLAKSKEALAQRTRVIRCPEVADSLIPQTLDPFQKLLGLLGIDLPCQ